MSEWTADRWASRLSKIIFTAVMVCAMAFAAAAPDRAFAGGDGGGGHDEEPGRQEASKEKETAKNKQKLFWAKRKMNKALDKVIQQQEYMKKKLHSPKTYNYSSEQFVEDMKEEDKLQRELEAIQKEVRELCKDLDVKEPAEATLVRPSVFNPADTSAAYKLESEKSTLEMLFDNSKNIQNADMIAGTSDTHGDRPTGSGNVYTATNDPMDYLW